MRIIHVVPSVAASTGGLARAVVDWSNALVGAGVDSLIVTTDLEGPARNAGLRGGIRPDEMATGVDLARTFIAPIARPYRIGRAPAVRQLIRELASTDTVLHLHSLYLYPQAAAAREAQSLGLPYILAPHGALDPYIRRRGRARKLAFDLTWQRGLLDNAAVLHVTSQAERQGISRLVGRVPRAVVPPVVRLEAFRGAQQAAGVEGAGPIVMNHGRLAMKKGLHLLAEAMPAVLRAVPDARLVLVGPDEEGTARQLRIAARRVGVESAVEIRAPSETAEIAALLSSATVWALPSAQENFAIAMVEALAAGRAVIASDALDLAADGERSGALVRVPRTSEAFAQAIIDLLLSPARRQSLAQRAVEFAAQFAAGEVVSSLVAMYRSVGESKSQERRVA